MQDTLALLLGLAGVILILVGLVGGGFTFSGSVMPAIRSKTLRVVSFSVGGLLVLSAIGIVAQATQVPVTPPAPSTANQAQVQVQAPSDGVAATVLVQAGEEALLYLDPNGEPTATLPAGAMVQLVCTIQGPAVQSRFNSQYWSTTWYGTSYGYYVADAVVDTGSTTADVPPC